ncbi:beta-induced protein ig-h3 [Seminavis robusta]|uniref:Beta-induced protein ig-h3 n=1 Tax=Seminavis robusta TaxID=568900 RepID=A0A9N8DJ58_9STRA|nr:beta-induced protein ig-h3 [Seminavis robusta]|eukprot:Sro116_g056970.1 beta-induced protein ig-h3 (712) ;mRNA; r:19934-22563
MVAKKVLFGLMALLLPGTIVGQQPSIVGIISRDLRFSTLVSLLTAAGLMPELSGPGPLTLFAPVNVAFANSRVNVTRLLQPIWTAHLIDLLKYQATEQEIWASDLEVGDEVVSTQDEIIRVTSSNPRPLILNDNATVFEQDKLASNGVVQAIDHVLLPISASQSIYDFVKDNPDYQVFTNLIERAGLIEEMSGPGPLTVFAPPDRAFGATMDSQWNTFVQDQQRVRNYLLYHFLNGNVFSAQLERVDTVQTVQGSDIDVTTVQAMVRQGNRPVQRPPNAIFLNTDSEIVDRDVLVSNGVLHVIDRPLTPPPEVEPTILELMEEQGLTVFVSAARRTGLLDILNNPSVTLTAFASVNTGFYPHFSLYMNNYDYHLHLKAAMEYQIMAGLFLKPSMTTGLRMPALLEQEFTEVTQGTPDTIIVNDEASVTTGDLLAINGALQVTNQVIIPPFHETDIIDVIARQPRDFSTLVYLLVLTGLIPDLSTDGPFTLFAPNNQAFDDLLLSSGLLSGSDWTSNLETMTEILKYHVVPGVVYAQDLTHNSTFTTLQGSDIRITIGDYYLDRRLNAKNDLERRLTSPNELTAPVHGRHLTITHEAPASVINVDARATVIEADMLASNGVVHSIDAVLIPSSQGWLENLRPDAPPSTDQVCLQWGDFDSLCCPIEPDAQVTIDSLGGNPAGKPIAKRGKQAGRQDNWYCDVMNLGDGLPGV